MSRRHNLTVEEVDIRSDPDLYRRYDILIPVLVVDGQEIPAPIKEEDVRRALRPSP
jgi:hypothetical protein